MDERTHSYAERFAETHRQGGAICNASTWMEYELGLAIFEVADSEDLSATQGDRWKDLVRKLKQQISAGAIPDVVAAREVRELLAAISAAMSVRDQVVHSTWMITNSTPPGHVTGQRFRRRSFEQKHWHPDQLENARANLEELRTKLSLTVWQAVNPPERQ
jgi:uncharacterized alpha-E superfamily protein